jgi:hypothetical protein
MSPVTKVVGIPGKAELVGGVQLGPDGCLGLPQPVTLTVKPSSLGSKPLQGLTWYGQGKNAGKYPAGEPERRSRSGSRTSRVPRPCRDPPRTGRLLQRPEWRDIGDVVLGHVSPSSTHRLSSSRRTCSGSRAGTSWAGRSTRARPTTSSRGDGAITITATERKTYDLKHTPK